MMQYYIDGLMNFLTFSNILFACIGVVIGTVLGAIPGFSGVTGIVVLLPFTFTMDPVASIVMLTAVFAAGTFGGAITATLIGVPGSPEQAPAVLDGYSLAKQGKANKAISMALYSSVLGGIFGALCLLFLAPLVARIALWFAPPEFFMLGIFGLSVIAGLDENNMIPGIIAGLVGVLISLIGMDSETGILRFTFGSLELFNGLRMQVFILGVFAIARVIQGVAAGKIEQDTSSVKTIDYKDKVTREEYKSCNKVIAKSSVIGVIIGVIPAVGAAVAAFISYNVQKRSSKDPSEYGKGKVEGIAAPEAASSALTCSSLIPLLTLGIPGSGGAAALLGAFMMHGLAPGPNLFRNHASIMYTIMVGLVLMNIMKFFVVKSMSWSFTSITRIPENAMVTCLFVICVAGAYSTVTSFFDVSVAIVVGIIVYVLTIFKFPAIPLVLGFVLGPMIESNFRRALVMGHGDPLIFVTRPVSVSLIFLTIIMLYSLKRSNKKAKD